MKYFITLSLLFSSLTAMADSLVCVGMNTKIIIQQEESYDVHPGAKVRVWRRDYWQSTYPDLFTGFINTKSVNDLVSKNVIKAKNFTYDDLFTLNLKTGDLFIKHLGALYQDQVECEYSK